MMHIDATVQILSVPASLAATHRRVSFMLSSFPRSLRNALARSLAQQLRLLDLRLTALRERLFVLDNTHVLLGEVDNLFVLDLPQVFRDLRDEPEVV